MEIRSYKPGDEQAQAEVYNRAAATLPGFKPTTAEEIGRRYRAIDPDPGAKLYAVEAGQIVGYALLNLNGRVSYPWCLPGAEAVREPLLQGVFEELKRRGISEAWAAYRADWKEAQNFLQSQGFEIRREMVNYVAEVDQLPDRPIPEGRSIIPWVRLERPGALSCFGNLFSTEDADAFPHFYLNNPFIDPTNLYALIENRDRQPVGVGLTILNRAFADPTKIDATMPCFRLGAFGTERQRHKRVNGLVSCGFAPEDEPTGATLLAEAARRLHAAGLTHAAAQAPSDQPALIAFYDRYFQRQAAFPILARRLGA
ncbi:hypothetical protein BH23PLA1_BH23PLA1_02830 [soil metagenome]